MYIIRKIIILFNLKKNILLRYYNLLKQDSVETKKNQSQIEKKLIEIVLHARKNTNYYKEKINEEIINKDGSLNYKKFENIPFLNKDNLTENFEDILNLHITDSDNTFKNTSGGSTGKPAVFIQDKNYVEWRTAIKLLFDKWSGHQIGKKKVVIWAAERDLNTSKNVYLNNLREFIKGEYVLNAYQMDENNMLKFIDLINKKKPNQILAYAESIYELSKFLNKKKISVYSPRAIMTSAGTLTTEMREVIESTFRTKVYNRYGSREVGDIASECMNNSMHIASLTNYVEVVREDGSICEDDELGEIVITSLNNFSMPLIRYKIGDVGAITSELCKCGKPHKVLNKLEGRTTDNFIKKNGTKVYGGAIRQIFYHKEWIKQYQIIQESLDEINLVLVITKEEKKLKKDLLEIENEIKVIMGSNITINFNFVEKINPLKNGKFRFTISKVKID